MWELGRTNNSKTVNGTGWTAASCGTWHVNDASVGRILVTARANQFKSRVLCCKFDGHVCNLRTTWLTSGLILQRLWLCDNGHSLLLRFFATWLLARHTCSLAVC